MSRILLWAVRVLAAIVAALGALWFAQGTGLIKLDPIACTGACEPVQAPSPTWILAGLLAMAVGVVVEWLTWRRRGAKQRQ